MSDRFDLSDYVPVNERIVAFKAEYPEGSLQSEVVLREGLVLVKAYAYRTPDDPRPGIGHSWMTVPGKTPYTRDSEVENAETSAWGRAIAALGFEVQRGIASRDEVDAKERERDARDTEHAATNGTSHRASNAPTGDVATDFVNEVAEGLCPIHRKPYKPRKSGDNTFYSDGQKMSDGTWCRERPPRSWVAKQELAQ